MSEKAASQALRELQKVFPELRAGRWNCRRISGSSTWSQHAWGAALDIHHKDWGYSASPTHQRWLDDVNAWLTTHSSDLSLRTKLWRVSNHFDHIHIDFWPRGYGTPPCNGGQHRNQYSNGNVVVGDPGPENGDWTGGGTLPPPTGGYTLEIHRSTIREGDRGDMVAISMSLLARHGFTPANSFNNNHEPDGIAGPGWDAACRSFQSAEGLEVDGICGVITWSALESV